MTLNLTLSSWVWAWVNVSAEYTGLVRATDRQTDGERTTKLKNTIITHKQFRSGFRNGRCFLTYTTCVTSASEKRPTINYSRFIIFLHVVRLRCCAKYSYKACLRHLFADWRTTSTNILWIREAGRRCARRMHSPHGITFLHEMTLWPPSWKCDVESKIRFFQSMSVYLKKNPVKFHPNPIRNDGDLSFLNTVAPTTRTARRTTK